MDQLIPSLDSLLAPLAVAFRTEVFALFRRMVAAWIVCLGRHTICRVWETTGQARQRNHAAAYRLFSQAVWNFDEVARVLLGRPDGSGGPHPPGAHQPDQQRVLQPRRHPPGQRLER